MEYPGNPSLAPEVQRRIQSTYEQSVELAAAGKRQEALLGCDFVLQLDPSYQPAAELKARLEAQEDAPTAAGAAAAPPTAPPPPREPADVPPDQSLFDGLDDDLDELDLPDLDLAGGELPDLGAASPLDSPPPAVAPGDPSADDPGGLARELAERLDRRDFQGILDRASEQRAAVAADPRLQEIATAALERLQAQPHVEQFLDRAREALARGDRDELDQALARARELDPGNPLIVELELAADDGPRPSPAAPPAPPEPPVAPPAAAGDGPADRIEELLGEGQDSFDRGEYQEAIDAWSRIFLIDVDHAEAASRIEDARRLKAEQERRAEELFHEGQAAAEEGDVQTAREKLEQVLALQPSHLPAKEALQRLEQPGADGAEAFRRVSPAGAGAVGGLGGIGSAGTASGVDAELEEEILVPPDPDASPADGANDAAGTELPGRRLVAVKKQTSPRLFLLIGGAVLLAVLAAGWFLLQHGESLFPNRQAETEAPVAPPVRNPIAEARRLHGEGKTAIALAQLERLRPDDPYYDQAQELIAEWGEEIGGEDAVALPEVTEESAAQRLQLLAAAGEAIASREYLRAAELYRAAEEIAPLDPGDYQRYEDARRLLEPLAQEIELVRNGEYEFVLPRLWERYRDQPSNRVVRRLIVDVYHNLGVRELQRGDPRTAAGHFEEALELAPDDPELQRLFLFAETYSSRSRDLLYRIYVKYLPLR